MVLALNWPITLTPKLIKIWIQNFQFPWKSSSDTLPPRSGNLWLFTETLHNFKQVLEVTGGKFSSTGTVIWPQGHKFHQLSKCSWETNHKTKFYYTYKNKNWSWETNHKSKFHYPYKNINWYFLKIILWKWKKLLKI